MNNRLTPDSEVDTFWGQLAPCDHCVQFYESDASFMDALEAFAAGGIRQGDAVIIIGTHRHRSELEKRLQARGVDVGAAKQDDQLIVLDASATLARFMVNDWPDEALFANVVAELLARARKHHVKVRAFGEMVALMWADGHCEATVQLEHLWAHLCEEEAFSLFCAYPKTGFAENVTDAMEQLCAAHSKVYVL
jgi:hypothetical protein